jgi:cytochrome c-type biogenesis protein CcmE
MNREILDTQVTPSGWFGMKPKFLIGSAIIVGALLFLVVAGTLSSAQYYLSVEELYAKEPQMNDRQVRVTGAVVRDSIVYDSSQLHLTFSLADDHAAKSKTLKVEYFGPKPDLMLDEATAIVEGELGQDGVFRADDLLLKCPTKYEDEQLQGSQGSSSIEIQ